MSPTGGPGGGGSESSWWWWPAGVPPHTWADHPVRRGEADPEEYVAQRLRRLLADGGVPPGLAGHRELGPQVRSAMVADLRLACTAPPPEPPLSCPVTVVAAREDPLVPREATSGWHRATRAETAEIVVPGDHFFYRSRPEVLARVVLGELAALAGGY